jgi:hypothetical protein
MSSNDVPQTATVPVTSGWTSKVNWTQAVAGAAMLITVSTGGKLNLTAEQQAAIVTVIGLVSQLATFILHTWFSPSVKAASLPSK